MIYRLHWVDVNNLLRAPETGMGYQVVEAAQYGIEAAKRYVVYNSELAINIDSEFKSYKRQIFFEGFSKALDRSSELILETKSIRVLNKAEVQERKALRFSESKTNKKRHPGDKGAKENPKESANGVEIFVRLSAYENDKRIDFDNKRLRPGTYTTTEQDYNECVSTNDDPIDRYALPNDEAINWAFYVRPKTGDTLQRGIVQPAFDHEGGGIEAYFENGTSNDTYFQKKILRSMTSKIKLLDNQIKDLESLPEQGMGYQIVDIEMKDGTILNNRIVLNSTYLQLKEKENIDPILIRRIRLHEGNNHG